MAWAGSEYHQLSFRILGKPREKKKRARRAKSMLREEGGAESPASSEGASDTGTIRTEASAFTSQAMAASSYKPISGWIELPPVSDGIERRAVDGDDDVLVDALSGPVTEDRLKSDYTLRLPPHEWNGMLFRRYRDQPEFYVARNVLDKTGRSMTDADSSVGDITMKSSKTQSVAETPPQSGTPRGKGALDQEMSAAASSTRDKKLPGTVATGSVASAFRLHFGMLLEFRIRVSDGVLWSNWSPPSQPGGVVPPIPIFSTGVRVDFSRREPTIARVSWGVCELPEDYEHLSSTIEYVVYVTSSESSAKSILQAGRN